MTGKLILTGLAASLWLTASPILAAASPDDESPDVDSLIVKRFDELSRQGRTFYQSGDMAAAEPVFRELVETQRQYMPPDISTLAELMNTHGLILEKLDRIDEAMMVFSGVATLKQKVIARDSHGRLKAQYNHGRLLSHKGLYTEASEMLRQSLDHHLEDFGETAPQTQTVRHEYTSALRLAGQLDTAYAEVQKLVAERRKLFGVAHAATHHSQNLMGLILYDLGAYQRAAEIHRMVMDARIAAVGETDNRTLTSKNNYALALSEMGKLRQAADYYETVWRTRQETLGKSHVDTLVSAHNHARSLLQLGEMAKARATAEDAAQEHILLYGEDHPPALNSRHLLGVIHRESGDYAKAEKILEQVALARHKALGDYSAPVADSYFELAKTRMRMPQKIESALEILGELTDGIQAQQLPQAGGPSGQSIFQGEQGVAKTRQYFETFADAGWALRQTLSDEEWKKDGLSKYAAGEIFEKLQFSQVNPAGQALARSAASRHSGSPAVLALTNTRENLLSRQKENARRMSELLLGSQSRDGDAIDILALAQKNILSQLEEVNKAIEVAAPDYFELIAPDALAFEEARTLLAPDEAALLIVPTDLGTHVLLVSDTGIQWHRSDWSRIDIHRAAQRLLWDVGANVEVSAVDSLKWLEEGEGAYPYDFETAHALYRELIAPLASQLNGISHLFVSASGALSSLPLGILVKTIPEGANGAPETLRTAQWFADELAIIQTPGIQSLRFLRSFRADEQPGAAKPFIGFGDPLLGGRSSDRGNRRRSGGAGTVIGYDDLFAPLASRNAAGIADIAQIRKLSRLPGTADELNSMWTFFEKPANGLYLAEKANEQTVRQSNLNAAVIAFATHGVLAGEIGGVAEPGLVLTPPQSASKENDGYLSSSEIAALSINASWVILSACNTAAGDGRAGAAGLSGLARSFFYAGAQNLLASHWPVRDDVAARLTVRTIEIASENRQFSRAQALQQAMRELRSDPAGDGMTDTWAHPNVWAPFSLVGDR
ncbi:CHAT domain-containing tetratricopeptide repeat protein [Sphingorhabdus sp. Alg239-R122]|uniref:CHAT domain-containing protein n=1 Tax=Sphingorhabdus sp. Alg239-R122 TaxID=2305989 RepID=UPI0013D936CB|nr:CHAT domain-containing tetratricopeptide repeat protein [Sphingorhabdus sp. Alg239-R122]